MATRPQNIGIKAIELYFPNQCVEQSALEKYDGVSEGKYTIGLGQTKMSFCDDREDMYSLALTAVSSLIKKYSIDPKSIGRLEVGTETMLDKSKSVKSVLMQLFEPSGNLNIEGVDTFNACYGGTNALFNTVNWLESSAWDGRDAIVVAGDIALYAKGAARPTGGVGCCAMLLGPNAPLVFEPGLRGTFIKHTYDFYKADFTSEYPLVDGHYSLKCYAQALDACYKDYNEREQKLQKATNGVSNGVSNGHGEANGISKSDGLESPLDRFDYVMFHSPTCKTVQKSYARLFYNDYKNNPQAPLFKDIPQEMATMDYETSLTDKAVEKAFQTLSKKRFTQRVQPTLDISTNCGNMYCASLYSGLCSLITGLSSSELQGKRLGLFSYGSGLASSLFSLQVKGSTEDIAAKLDIKKKLAERKVVEPQVYDEMCELRKKAHLQKSFSPAGSVENLLPGTYYLTGIDDMFRRSYAIKE